MKFQPEAHISRIALLTLGHIKWRSYDFDIFQLLKDRSVMNLQNGSESFTVIHSLIKAENDVI